MQERAVRELGIDMHTLLSLKWLTNKDLLERTGKSAQRHVAAWMGGESGGVEAWTYKAESLRYAPETIAAL